MTKKLEIAVADLRRAMEKTPYSHHTVDKETLSDILDYAEAKLKIDRELIKLGDTVQITNPKGDARIGVIIRESDYPEFIFELRLPDGEEITVFQENVEKIHV